MGAVRYLRAPADAEHPSGRVEEEEEEEEVAAVEAAAGVGKATEEKE